MLPAGFKVNGIKAKTHGIPVPPAVKKIIDFLNSLPASELLTTAEVAQHMGCSLGSNFSHPTIVEYKAKVDKRLLWGSKRTILRLKKKLTEVNGEN